DWPRDAAIGKTLVSSMLLDALPVSLGRRLLEVPVGFKWCVPCLLDGSVAFGGEESAGASFLRRDGSVWSTDKDGILLCLLAAEIIAVTGKSPSERYRELEAAFGSSAYQRVDAPATPEQKATLGKLSPDAVSATELAGEEITAKLSHAPGNGAAIGGLKVQTEHAWFAARPSGTEDVYKLYAESLLGPDHLAQVQEEARPVVGAAVDGCRGCRSAEPTGERRTGLAQPARSLGESGCRGAGDLGQRYRCGEYAGIGIFIDATRDQGGSHAGIRGDCGHERRHLARPGLPVVGALAGDDDVGAGDGIRQPDQARHLLSARQQPRAPGDQRSADTAGGTCTGDRGVEVQQRGQAGEIGIHGRATRGIREPLLRAEHLRGTPRAGQRVRHIGQHEHLGCRPQRRQVRTRERGKAPRTRSYVRAGSI